MSSQKQFRCFDTVPWFEWWAGASGGGPLVLPTFGLAPFLPILYSLYYFACPLPFALFPLGYPQVYSPARIKHEDESSKHEASRSPSRSPRGPWRTWGDRSGELVLIQTAVRGPPSRHGAPELLEGRPDPPQTLNPQSSCLIRAGDPHLRRGALGHANLCRGGPQRRYSPRTGFVRDTVCGGGVRPPYQMPIYMIRLWT